MSAKHNWVTQPVTERAAIEQLLVPVLSWIATGGDAWQMNLNYWEQRRRLMDEGEAFDGPASEYLSNIDTAMDSFSPKADRGWHQIDEAQLRSELETALDGIRRSGLLPQRHE
jgi:hypothetical protein